MNPTQQIILLLAIFLMVYFLAGKLTKVIGQKRKVPPFRINGLRFLIRFGILVVFAIILLTLQGFPTTEFISISSIMGIVIGFASTEIIGQLVSGIYIISSRPFKVGDFIKIENMDGIVIEIGIMYTVLQRIDGTIIKIPNKNILDSKFKNYTIKFTPELLKRRYNPIKPRRKVEYTEDQKPNMWKEFWHNISDNLEEQEITRFTFDFEVDLSISPQRLKIKMSQICHDYANIFGYLPKYNTMGIGIRLMIRFRIYCHNPYLILENYPNLLYDISESLYGEGES